MGHDERFKEFLQTFLQEFLRLFFPEVERRLDFRGVEFLDKEVFTGLAEGKSRRADVVARLDTQDGNPESVLIHIEIQARREKRFPARMFEYYSLLQARYRLPVYPIVVYLRGGKEGLTWEVYRTRLFGADIQWFRYKTIALARLDVEEYRRGVGPVGAALGALMDSSRTKERAELRASLLLQIIESKLDETRQLLLANLIENYLELTTEEWDRYRQLVSREEYRKVQDVEETWMDRLLREGRELGVVEGKRQMLLTLVSEKFGALPDTVRGRVETIDSPDELDGFLKRILTASSLEDLGLDQ